ncbi:uncharacterized protein MONOS_2244 [Monocercomonoides exilis]|uniref:uncharacterized protein n=1 Tax=Monocercomonoides exilis TaxID=2049356 RepID=UPI00355A3F80|nr:hypothetical protein MONOS_2244 [Monocercomonoides exilis]|eukprot:MONOS_2244.1-p1 / transcript=MONOS_2244.1 / gene=MONOS_2244 / organism=Monocercomonoides_exilis_PA203 / gene_product=unspecified product / transcript_product=unspecified product / location=Mono_scaffold00045:56741-64513(-) / protein_length=2573 / sequence_SO=supercontig / SO=protein_coding / is_pseudo=false
MNMHLRFLACLLLANMFEIQGVSGSSTWKSEGNASDARLPSKGDDNLSFEQQNAPGVKKCLTGISTVINAFLGFNNSTVGLKNLAFEYSSPSCVQITDKSIVVMESCISLQKSTTPFHLQSGSIILSNMSLIPQKNIYSSSLVFSSDDSNSMDLRNSIMTDLAVSSSECFLLSGKSKSEKVTNCVFRNMSVKSDKSSDNKMEHFCIRSGMEGCLIYSCVNVFEGGISDGSFSPEEFICRNTSINFGKREMNALEKKGQMNITDSQSFSLCEWTDCTAPQGGALYVHDNSNAILKVENSSFTRCNATSTRGGGIYALNIAESIVLHSVFVQCSAAATTNAGGGGIMEESICVQPIVDDCSFQNCSSGNDGGAIDLRPTMTKKQKQCIVNSFFINCKVNHTTSSTGGAVEHWDCIDKVVISNCLFRDCYSKSGGGAACQRINEKNDGILFYYCFFHNNSCEQGGYDIALQGSSKNNIDSTCYSTRQASNRVSLDYLEIVDKSEWLRNDFGRVRFVSSAQKQPNAMDSYACGLDKSYPCSTISRCLTQLIPDLVPNVEVSSGTIIETNSFECGINAFTVYGQSNMSTAIHTEFEASGLSLFSVSTGTLTARDFVVVHDSSHPNNRGSRLFEISGAGGMSISRLNISFGSGQSIETAFSTELINVQNGMFQMEHVNWAKTISTNSLFSLSSTNEISLALSECAFDGIERTTSGASVMSFSNDKVNMNLDSCSFLGCGSTTSTDGGSMMLCVGSENEVKVKGGSFDGCYCSATYGFGGGILLRLLNENPNFLISSSFGTNAAKWGKDIFVFSPNLEETTKSQKISCITASLDSFDKVRGYDKGNNSLAIPLCIYLFSTPEEIFVSNTKAYDHSHCGIVEFPCLTMKHSIKRQTETKKVTVSGMIMMSDELAFEEQKHEIRGNSDQSGWTVSDASSTINSAMITANVETELSKLIFSLPSSFSLHSTFISSSSQLTLSHCSLSLQDHSSELTFLFLSVESGTSAIDTFSASSIDLNGNPLISLCGSSTKTESMSIKWLNMTNCTFSEMERAAGSGGCVSIDNSNDENSNGEINIEECDFDRCSVFSDESGGGAIYAQLKGNTHLDIISCTFTGCSAPADEEKIGFGGGMALKLIDDDSSFVISSPIFDADKPNIAKYGNDLFVESSNLTKSITNTSLPFVSENLDDISLNSMRGFDGNDTTNAIPMVYFWFTLGSEVFIRNDGKDVCICGLSDYPCLSIDYSLDRFPEGNERNINIIGKGILKKCVDLSRISVKSDDEEMCFLECLSSLEGAEEAAMKISGITDFELIDFVVPSSFTGGVNYLMHVGSSEGLLTLKDCSFSKNEESREEEMINFGLIEADEGTVVFEFVAIQSLSFSQDIISVHSTTILNMKNLTMKNIELEGASGLCVAKSSGRGKNEAEQDIVIECSSFEEVTQNATDDIPIIRDEDIDEPLKMVIRNTTMKKCGGTRCRKGGGIFCALNEGGMFDCSFCTISECFCSSTGRGGWLFLECISAAEQPLNFVLSNITFRDNSALRGRDVYVRCHSIETQIVDEQFLLDFRTPYVKELAIWGCTTDSFVGEEDLLLRVGKYQSETIFVSAIADNHADSKQCGEFSKPCESMNEGVQHIIPSSYSQLLMSEETIINGESNALNVIIRSLEFPSSALVHMNSTIAGKNGSLLKTSEKVRIESVKFNFDQSFSYSGNSLIHEFSGQLSLLFVDFSSVGESNNNQPLDLNSTLLSVSKGILHVDNCSISMLSLKKPYFLLNGDEVSITNMKLEKIELTTDVFEIGQYGSAVLNGVSADGVKLSEGCVIAINDSSSSSISIGSSSFNNCSRNSEGASVFSSSSTSVQIVLSNCSCSDCNSLSSKGSVIEVRDAADVSMHMCEVEGILAKEWGSERNNDFGEICEWNGSLVHSANSSLVMKYITILNASSGGLSVSAGDVTVEKGEFLNNNPFIEKYPSLRRNIICSDSASLTISSLKGGDGVKDYSSLWILNDRCDLRGIAGERSSPFFIPKLEDVSVNENGSNVVVKFKGSLFVPCDLSFRVVYKTGDVELVETYPFEEDSFVSEAEVIGTIPSANISTIEDETEILVMILFGKPLAETSPQILKNRSESKVNGDERISEGGKEGKSSWALIIAVIFVVLFLIVLIVSVILAVRWRKAKNEAKDLREIVNDTVRKDPKLIEMTTMEMSPEEQWRRAEREAEKKNEEKIKKRVYAKSLGHSESSEHLLSESGSTEYILGRDSDKIPEWTLEKVDEKEEEEETRKRTPSPSISSTSTTDSDSTFVRGEDLCPTTSSMSNLVDAMACSSPHEKLIVDLRDSLFMLLHGRNKTKEMAIGTLQEREQTAAQILFWVANLALHSFDEMENGLSSLVNLSPHIVLFSEHMVICIVMHSDLLSDDSDSSSVSSSTVATSASDDDDEDSLPSLVFEDEGLFKKECLRWKAPELLINKNMDATKESVSFSIGMMLWECLTLQIPFGDYEAEVAGQKIVNGERTDMAAIGISSFCELIKLMVSEKQSARPTLSDLKREFIQKFPAGAVILTVSDAVTYQEGSREKSKEEQSGSLTSSEIMFISS